MPGQPGSFPSNPTQAMSTLCRDFEYVLVPHARCRMQQRGVTAAMIRTVVQHGEIRESHGRLCHLVTGATLRELAAVRDARRLHGLCVVTEPDGRIVTIKRLSTARMRRWRRRR